MFSLTEKQISEFSILAKKQTSVESCGEDWNPYEVGGGNFDDVYYVGYNDAEIINARFILNLFEIKY